MNKYILVFNNDELYHYGTKGQKWYLRRYQNPDGTLTEAGKLRYRKYTNKVSNDLTWKAAQTKDKKLRKQYELELKAISKMTIEDVIEEQRHNRRSYFDSLITFVTPDLFGIPYALIRTSQSNADYNTKTRLAKLSTSQNNSKSNSNVEKK